MGRTPIRSEEGSALMLVLALLTMLSLALGAIFSNIGANLTMSTVVASRNNQRYAADGGVEYAIQQLRANSALCGTAGPLAGPAGLIDGYGVAVTCAPVAGTATSVSPWALVTTEPARFGSSLSTSGGPQAVDGPVYVRGQTDLDSPLTVSNGAFLQNWSGCTAPNPNATVQGLYVSKCLTTPMPIPYPAPLPTLPPLPTVSQPATPAITYHGCSIWKPGTYSADLQLDQDNYFASGVYYFDNAAVDFDGVTGVGGQPGPDYQKAPALPDSACANVTDKTAGVTNGSGVEFILGGTSTLSIEDGGSLELFARVPPTPSEGTPGISIRTVPPSAAPAGWTPTASGDPTVLSASGTSPQLAVHGYVYLPEGSVDLSPHAGSTGILTLAGGLLCWQASLASTGGTPIISGQSAVSAQPGTLSQARTVDITATVQGITSTAVISIGNDQARTVTVQSWLTKSG